MRNILLSLSDPSASSNYIAAHLYGDPSKNRSVIFQFVTIIAYYSANCCKFNINNEWIIVKMNISGNTNNASANYYYHAFPSEFPVEILFYKLLSRPY